MSRDDREAYVPLPPERRDHRIQHIAAIMAKLTDDDSVKLFSAFLLGDVGPALADIIDRRVEDAVVEYREQLTDHYDERLEDVRRELNRHLSTIERQLQYQTQRADRSAEAIARVRQLADLWEADCDGQPHRLCKGGRLRAAIAGTQ